MTHGGIKRIDLNTIVVALEAALIPHMVVGSFASTAHEGPRTTRDLDLVIDPSPDQLNELLGVLDSERFYVDPDAVRIVRAQLGGATPRPTWGFGGRAARYPARDRDRTCVESPSGGDPQ